MPGEVERHLHRSIPLSAAMGVTVVVAGPERVELAAPLTPNLNHRDTLFGGSAAAIATLAAWVLVQQRLAAAGVTARLVISRSAMTYDTPVDGDFTAVSEAPDAATWSRFLGTLGRHRKARVTVHARLVQDGEPAAGSRATSWRCPEAARTGAPPDPLHSACSRRRSERAGEPQELCEETMYAIIRAGGKQSKVREGDVIDVERIKAAGDTVTFTPLLVVGDDGTVISERDALDKATVTAEVVGEHRGEKIEVFKYKAKTGYRRRQGHRQTYTTLRVTSIGTGAAKKKTRAKKAAEPTDEAVVDAAESVETTEEG